MPGTCKAFNNIKQLDPIVSEFSALMHAYTHLFSVDQKIKLKIPVVMRVVKEECRYLC